MNENRYCLKCFEPITKDDYAVRIANENNETSYHRQCFSEINREEGLPILSLNNDEQTELVEQINDNQRLKELITKILNHE